MIPKSAINWQGLVKAISRYRFKRQIPRGRSREHGGSSCPEPWQPATAVPVLKLYSQSKNPAGRRRRPFQYPSCRERKSNRPPETAVPVLKLYYQRTKIQPAARDGRSSTKVVGCRRRPFEYHSCTTRERKPCRPQTPVEDTP